MGRTDTRVKSSFERLAAINRVITTSLNFTEALRLIVDNAVELFAADNSLLLLAEADGRLRVKAAYADSETTSQFSGPMEESVIRDLSRHLKLDPARELATAPIVVHGSINGLLAIVRESQLTTEEQWQLSALADQAAIALNNARLHEFQTGEVMRQRDESLAALHDSNRKIHNILESITDLYYQLDRQWRFTDINRQTAKQFRRSREELLGHVLWEVFPEAVESELYPQLHKALAEMVPVHFDFASNIVPGVWFEAHAYPSKAGLSVYLRDITERKGAELANNLLAAIVESSDDAIVSKDLNGIIQSWNDGAQRIFGYQPHEVIGKHITILIPVDSHAEETEIMGRIRRGVRVDHYETIRIRKDGSPINVSLTISPVRNAQGQVIGASKIARDITESKKAQEQLKRTLDFDETVMLSMGEGLYTVDTEDRATFMNPAAQKLFGWNLDEVLGRSMHDVTHHTRPDGTPFPQEECAGFRVLHEGKMLSEFEDVFIRKDGTFFDVVYSSSPLRADGKITGLAVVFRDVSDRKQAEQERERLLKAEQVARAEAEKANRLKDEFLATLSHELRNPLNVVIGYSEILRRSNESQKHEFVVHAAETIRRNALAQSQLVSDLLDLSRLQMGKLSLDCQPVSLSTIMTDAIETVRAETAAKSIALEVALDPEPVVVEGDPIRLAQIAWNLLNNAIKFTPPEGRVKVALDQEGDHARVTVEDSGQGIAPQFLPHVFEMFRQADASIARRQGGMGIGLALVQQLTTLHGGTVQAESEGSGQGARFTVCIPLFEQGESGLAPASPGATGALRRKFILVVDDSPETTEMLSKLLEMEGAFVESAASGAEALQIASKKRFDLIISDISMPEMDGYQLLSSLRELPEMAAVPAVALTGYGRNADIERAKEEGFSEHLTKPLDIDRLLQVVRELTD